MTGGLSIRGRWGRIWAGYERQLAKRPVMTQMATSALLWSAGDILAQRLVEQRRTADVDVRRVVLTAGFGACFMGPVGHFWYHNLDVVCAKLLPAGSPGFLAAKLAADTAIMGPAYVLAFYAWGCALIDGSGLEGFKAKITQDFLPTFVAELALWPLFQAFNFTRVPLQHQLLAVNGMTLVDACFLSWARSQDDWVATVTKALQEFKDSRSAPPAPPSQMAQGHGA
ncbi:Protein sym1 [Tetrabaena socialis]|uniref:Protein sym1 n=1 Tax=Tetrabaena socialis TaxID=47790 RepID=A0A2J8A4B4_9CHLO|nr:Protein sym1 [Tetrabaena socialis]|eukprot:PNH07347.1 Protein sym1 [Tetrabaena socialis]